jgi:hypothetical protein
LATSASFAENSNEATTALTATSASFAQTASFALNADVNPFPFTGSADISGSINLVGRITKLEDETESLYIGEQAGEFTTATNRRNLGIGFQALRNNNQSDNVAIGRETMALATGGSNVAIGFQALSNNSGDGNVAIGDRPLSTNTSGASNNTVIGRFALQAVTGNENVGVGFRAGSAIEGESEFGTGNTQPQNSIFIGSLTKASGSNDTNQIVIGHGAIGKGSNTTVIGNNDTTLTLLKGSVEATGGFVGDLTGTASFATVSGTTVSASFADNATSASFADFATSASFAENSNTSTTALTATSASFADFSLSSSFADFATSASFANFATNASNADLADNATSADVAISASFADFATSASFADFATSASFADFAASASFSDTSSEALSVSNAALPNNITVGGVLLGNVENIAQAATASLDFGTANFFQIELNENDDTLIDITGIKAGLTVNVEVTTKSNSTVSFPASVKKAESYVPTDANGIDILTFIAFDDATVYLSTIKSLD